jgi:hypothetical protein
MVATALTAAATVPGATAQNAPRWHENNARLLPLNSSGAVGHSEVKSRARWLKVEVDARGLTKGVPHAMHIHFGKEARHECPNITDDANGDFRLTTLEGVPAYGPVAVSLTKRGDTSPASVLAVDRFPTAPKGEVHYFRTTKTNKAVARAIRRGNAVVVVHGIDYNGNGTYDFDSAGASDLDSSLPAEATDPALCGRLRMG